MLSQSTLWKLIFWLHTLTKGAQSLFYVLIIKASVYDACALPKAAQKNMWRKLLLITSICVNEEIEKVRQTHWSTGGQEDVGMSNDTLKCSLPWGGLMTRVVSVARYIMHWQHDQ